MVIVGGEIHFTKHPWWKPHMLRFLLETVNTLWLESQTEVITVKIRLFDSTPRYMYM